MMAIVFEVEIADGRQADYLAIAAALKAELVQMDGFISIERFQSLNDPGKLLSLSFWRDEAAITAWRNRMDHRAAQGAGRAGIFSDYRLSVVEVVRQYGMHDRHGAPADSLAIHDGVRTAPAVGE